MTEHEVFEKAILRWGDNRQKDVACEECAELIKAVMKFNRAPNVSSAHDILSEIADVEIMLGQLKIIFGDFGSFYPYYEKKLARLEGLVSEGI